MGSGSRRVETQLEWMQDPFWERSQEQETSVTSQLCNPGMVTAPLPPLSHCEEETEVRASASWPWLELALSPCMETSSLSAWEAGAPRRPPPQALQDLLAAGWGGERHHVASWETEAQRPGLPSPAGGGRWGQVLHTSVSEGSLGFPLPGLSPSTRVGLVTAAVQVDQSKFSTCVPEKVLTSSLVLRAVFTGCKIPG